MIVISYHFIMIFYNNHLSLRSDNNVKHCKDSENNGKIKG